MTILEDKDTFANNRKKFELFIFGFMLTEVDTALQRTAIVISVLKFSRTTNKNGICGEIKYDRLGSISNKRSALSIRYFLGIADPKQSKIKSIKIGKVITKVAKTPVLNVLEFSKTFP